MRRSDRTVTTTRGSIGAKNVYPVMESDRFQDMGTSKEVVARSYPTSASLSSFLHQASWTRTHLHLAELLGLSVLLVLALLLRLIRY
jgi:hypothetical protein